MKRKKQGAAILLAGIMMSSSTIVWANSYQDTQGHWAEKAITTWSERSVLNGYNGLFRPNDTITRGEMAVILDRIMYYTEKQQNTFADLDQAFYTDSILKAAKAGTLVGADGFVRPKESITRQEAIIMLARALSITPVEGNTQFTDDANIADWAKGYVLAMAQRGYISASGTFRPDEPISRAEVASLLDNSIENIVTEDMTDYAGKGKDVIMNTADRTLQNSVIEGDLILAEGIGEGDVTLDNVTVKGSVIVKGGGIHSVRVKNSNIANVSVQKKSSPVRVVVEQGSNITNTTVTASSILEGNFNTVSVSSPADVTVRGNVENMQISAKTNLHSDSGTIKAVNITSTGAGSIIRGTGSVQNVAVGAENVSVETANTNVTVSQGVSKATVSGKTTSGGTQSKSSSNSSSSSSSSSSSNRRPSSSGGGGGSSSGGSSGGGSSSSGGSTNQVSDVQIRNVESVSNSLVRVTLSKKTKEPLTLKDFSIICTGGGSNMTIMNVRTNDNRTYELTTAYYKDNTYNLQVTINGKYANKDFVVKYDCAELTSQEIKRTGETTAEFSYRSDTAGTFYYAVAKESDPVLAAYDNAESGISVNSILPEGTQPTAEQLVSSGTASNMKLGLNTVKISGLQKDTAYTFYYMAVDIDGKMTPVRQMTIEAKAPEKPKPPTNPALEKHKIVSFEPHKNNIVGPNNSDPYDFWYTVEFNKPITEKLIVKTKNMAQNAKYNVRIECPKGDIELDGKIDKVNDTTYTIYVEKGSMPMPNVNHTITVTLSDGTKMQAKKKFPFDYFELVDDPAPMIISFKDTIKRFKNEEGKQAIDVTLKTNGAGYVYYTFYRDDDSRYPFEDKGGKNPEDLFKNGTKKEIKAGENPLKNILLPVEEGEKEYNGQYRFCCATESNSGNRIAYFEYSDIINDKNFPIQSAPSEPDTPEEPAPDAQRIVGVKVGYGGGTVENPQQQRVQVIFNNPIGSNFIDNSDVAFSSIENPTIDYKGPVDNDDGTACIGVEILLNKKSFLQYGAEHTITFTVGRESYDFTFELDEKGQVVKSNGTTPAMLSMVPTTLSLENKAVQSDIISDSTKADSNNGIENAGDDTEKTADGSAQQYNVAKEPDSTENTDSDDTTDNSDTSEQSGDNTEKSSDDTTKESDSTENTDSNDATDNSNTSEQSGDTTKESSDDTTQQDDTTKESDSTENTEKE